MVVHLGGGILRIFYFGGGMVTMLCVIVSDDAGTLNGTFLKFYLVRCSNEDCASQNAG